MAITDYDEDELQEMISLEDLIKSMQQEFGSHLIDIEHSDNTNTFTILIDVDMSESIMINIGKHFLDSLPLILENEINDKYSKVNIERT